jgi:hypothetical protein
MTATFDEFSPAHDFFDYTTARNRGIQFSLSSSSQSLPYSSFRNVNLSLLGGCREEVRAEVQGLGFIGRHGEFVVVMAW